ncbi:sugar ABC transporter, permease component [Renibacterium salmoninarum ATCC 33209]|uniref:Sugar ABC transporter, permease component n=1 Tax=Renibacterium salmoninarum (strain ATCC 33209 / DSM 20767 / JCM 11484 / NBRC 15589 / NCIMB 2235) TaxID=288705 RepID=A9WLZ6_RENSM|nr:sugar ABC transporter permease [Renibacterium salmoninarum]ABY22177.1 sugar ABC transporter, permease component [Renibacterium salmoninarum ATCC 33209]
MSAPTIGGAASATSEKSIGGRRRNWLRALPLLPAVLLLLAFLAGPVIYSVYLAFTNKALRGEGSASTEFVGLANFSQAFSSGQFWHSVFLTLIFTLVSAVIGQNILGMLLALLTRSANKIVTTLTSAIIIAAWILPEIVAGYLWYTFLGEKGSLNGMLGFFGLPAQDLLISFPILAVAFANIWRGTAFSMLIYRAALSQVSPDVDESAQLDGAGAWRRFFAITLPIIRRSVLTNLMLITLQTLSVFGLIYIMTAGGPAGASQTLPLFMYEQAFSFGQLGYGTAIALLLLLIGAIASLIYLRMLPKEDKS